MMSYLLSLRQPWRLLGQVLHVDTESLGGVSGAPMIKYEYATDMKEPPWMSVS